MEIPVHDLHRQYETIREEIDAALREVLENTSFVLGEPVESFEEAFATYCGTRHCLGVSSGTAALKLIYRALDLQPGDEVITTPFTFIGTVEPLLHMGVRPVFADIDPTTFNLDPDRVAERIGPDTRAIVAVDLYGQPADYERLGELADDHDLTLIEDAAQAHGARWEDRVAGSLGDVAAFSFYPSKNLGAYGDAGGITTSDSDLAERLRRLRDHGREGKYRHSVAGYNERLDGFQGAVLSVKLRHLDAWSEARREHAAFYDERLAGLPLEIPTVVPPAEHVYYQYVVRTEQRDALRDGLHERGVGAAVHYPRPVHLQPPLRELGYEKGDYPRAEAAAGEVLSLPVFAQLTREELDYVVEQLREVLSGIRGVEP